MISLMTLTLVSFKARFYPSIENVCVQYTVLVQKGNKDIIKIVHVTSVD